MSGTQRTALFTLAGLTIISIGTCGHFASKYEQAFLATSDGETIAMVVGRFGKPSLVEENSKPFLRYASKPCEQPCAKRLWWEHPIKMDIEAWSVEFNSEGKVIHKAHWLSP